MTHAIHRTKHHIRLTDNVGQFLVALMRIAIMSHTATTKLTNRLFIVHGGFGQAAKERHGFAV